MQSRYDFGVARFVLSRTKIADAAALAELCVGLCGACMVWTKRLPVLASMIHRWVSRYL
jgi:hypothetical protein